MVSTVHVVGNGVGIDEAANRAVWVAVAVLGCLLALSAGSRIADGEARDWMETPDSCSTLVVRKSGYPKGPN